MPCNLHFIVSAHVYFFFSHCLICEGFFQYYMEKKLYYLTFGQVFRGGCC